MTHCFGMKHCFQFLAIALVTATANAQFKPHRHFAETSGTGAAADAALSATIKSGLLYGWSLAGAVYSLAGGKSGLHRAACRLTAGGVRSKRISRKVPQKIYRRDVRAQARAFGKGEKVR